MHEAAAAVGRGSGNPCFGFLWGFLGFLHLQYPAWGNFQLRHLRQQTLRSFGPNKFSYIKSEAKIASNIYQCFVNGHDYFVLIQLITFPA